jgi:putative transposase
MAAWFSAWASVAGTTTTRSRASTSPPAADVRMSILGVMRRRWSGKPYGDGVGLSDLLPGRSSGGRGGGRLPDEAEAIVQEVLRTPAGPRWNRSGRPPTVKSAPD